MAKTIKWTKRAYLKFEGIIDYLEREWGDKVTESFVQRSYDIIELISEQPEIGTMENKVKNIRGFLLTKHNRLFYKVKPREIIILNFFDTRSKGKKKSI